MKRLLILMAMAATMTLVCGADDLASNFSAPPASARPWVYWFPLSGNLTKEGITADLEAMARVGIGGVLYMEVDQGAPKGPADFGGPLWRELFRHACNEAHRLGLEINMNNDAGWCGSGGPWITPELSMQKVVWTETVVDGGKRFEGVLAKPPAVKDFYRDIAVLAMPTPGDDKFRLTEIDGKASFKPKWFAQTPATFPAAPAAAIIPRDGIVDLSAKMDASGKLAWDAPAGKWLVMRFGHTTTGKDNHPAPESGRGLECDKFSREAAAVHYNGLMAKVIADNKPLSGEGKVLVSTHIDSWEVGSQNWTPKMREEFKNRRGYDLLPFLPAFTGRVIGSAEVTERFLWDLRQTVSDLIVENYAGEFRRLAHQDGLRLSIEAYDGAPVDEMTYGGQADEPMAEFWAWSFGKEGGKFGCAYSCWEMASVGHIYGRKVIGAEAFTSTNKEKWLGHPANIKDLGDWAFCEGINRFVFHRYAAQPWIGRAPGMGMGPWGLHYERTQTWWEQSKAWHEYLARCQYLLQQGLFVADVLYLQAEGAPRRFTPPADAEIAPHLRGGYNYDGCTQEVVLTRLSVKDGRLVLPDGMSYRVLVLPDVGTMTPRLLRKVGELVAAGATVIAAPNPPQKAPGLATLGAGDAEVKALAAELWPKLVTGTTAGKFLASRGVKPDFSATPKLRHIHRTIGDAEVYFVANPEPRDVTAVATFRIAGKQPELWWPDSGRILPAAVFEEKDGVTSVPLQLEPSGSVFVVFRKPSAGVDAIVGVTRDGKALLPQSAGVAAAALPDVSRTFTVAVWVKPDAETTLLDEAKRGIAAFHVPRNDVLYPPPGHEVWTAADAGMGLAVGRNGVTVLEHGADHFAAVLVQAVPVTDWTHVAVVYRDGMPALYLNGKPVRTGQKSEFTVHGGAGVVHTRGTAPFKGRKTALQQFDHALADAEILKLAQTSPAAPVTESPVFDFGRGEIWQSGDYTFTTAGGRKRELRAVVPVPQEIAGPWAVAFDPKWGGPAAVTFDKLEDWTKRPEEGIKYYSGSAVYRTTFRANAPVSNTRLYLDLGRVEVMAEVKLNGTDLGILWKPPYRVDVTGVIRDGENTLEVKVVNLWINRQIGDEQLPEDSDRNKNGTLKSWPQWLQAGKPSPAGRYTFSSWRLWKKGDQPIASGLLGPVQVMTAERITP